LVTVDDTWCIKLTFLSMITPRYLSLSLTGTGTFLMHRGRNGGGLCLRVNNIDSHLGIFRWSFHFLHHGVIWEIWDWMIFLADAGSFACAYTRESSAKRASLVLGF